jgi:hypothetical protein
MDSNVRYYAAVATDTPEMFARRFPHPFLVREPSAASALPIVQPDDMEAEIATSATNVISMGTLRALADDAAKSDWIIIELSGGRRSNRPPAATYVKNRGLQLSLSQSAAAPLVAGRSRHCDVRLPFLSVSHVHAHLFVHSDYSIDVVDQSSTNGTFINNARCPASVKRRARPGDKLKFGGIVLTLMDPVTLYERLKANQPSSERDEFDD